MSSGDWLDFEHFAAEFLAPEFPSLRTTASPHGDRGRDGQMYVIDEDPNTVVQYSVSQGWAAKIRATVERLKETMPNTRTLIYATNQIIGPDADSLVSDLRRTDRISLDIRDRNWFVDRELTYPQRSVAATELAHKFVDPLLVERGVRSFVSPALGRDEARIALVHLALEGEDLQSSKGWTRSCFEALVLSALNDTSNDNRMTSAEIISRVHELLPSSDEAQISRQIESALNRLTRRSGPVKLKNGSYALSFSEGEELRNRLASFALQEEDLKKDLVATVKIAAPRLEGELDSDGWLAVAESLRLGLEVVLLAQGEEFATAVTTGEAHQANAREVLAQVTASVHNTAAGLTDEEATAAIIETLERPSPNLRNHLRRLADAYTMYAFLRQTSDVQRVVLTIFTGGDLWLDTSVILPLFAETLLEDPAERRYTTILRAALDAGLRLYMTPGVVEEVDSHLNRCLVCARTDIRSWRSSIPFVFAAYTLSGRGRGQFATWLERFRGQRQPIEDICEYLADTYAIDLRSLEEEASSADPELRTAVQEIWYEAHERRRGEDESLDLITMNRLVSHDVENCLGVFQLRQASPASPMGYRYWYLTLDRVALTLKRALTERLGRNPPDSPALSPDFMTQYLRLAPVRTAVERQLWANLPLLTDVSRYDFVPKELIARADELRREIGDLDERIIRRRVRDTLNDMKLEEGPQALAGIRGMERGLSEQIMRSRDRPQA
jgi:hypothetical protein